MKKKQKNRLILIIITAISVAGIIVALFIRNARIIEKNDDLLNAGNAGMVVENAMDAGCSVEVTAIGAYTGAYMEDGSDQEVSDILMIEITNTGKEPIQYGEIALFAGDEQAGLFKFSTLMPEETMVVLEAEKQPYNDNAEYTKAAAENIALFQSEPQLYSDKLEIQPLDGGMNITNISGDDIEGEIIIYFKDYKDEKLNGGITYRGRIEGGLKKGEVRQIMSSRFTENNTKIMFITIDGK